MFTLGIDIDGTLTRRPETFLALMRCIRDGGGRVFIVTSVGPQGRDADARREQLFHLGIAPDEYDGLLLARGDTQENRRADKAAFCRQHMIKVMIEDNREIARAIKRNAPDTMVLMV